MNIAKLRRAIAESGLSEAEIATELGMSCSELNMKIDECWLGIDDAEILIRILKIENPVEVFFGSE